MFRVKVFFLPPVVQNCTCLTCLLVLRGCCRGLSAAVTIVLTDLSGSKICWPYCHTVSSSYAPRKSRLFDDALFCWHIPFIENPHSYPDLVVWTTVLVESPCLSYSFHHMCAANWWLPTFCSSLRISKHIKTNTISQSPVVTTVCALQTLFYTSLLYVCTYRPT